MAPTCRNPRKQLTMQKFKSTKVRKNLSRLKVWKIIIFFPYFNDSVDKTNFPS